MAQRKYRKSARVLLTVVAPVVVAVLGVSLGLASGSAQADNGQPVILGGLCDGGSGTNCASSTTMVENTGGGDGLDAIAAGGTGLYGNGQVGVSGQGTGYGVEGSTFSTADGVSGVNAGGGNGVSGDSEIGSGNGVYGHASNSGASGVYGLNDGTGFGVAGRAATGTGVLGDSAGGVGVLANSANAIALEVTGKAQFSRSGLATVAGTTTAPKSSVQVFLPITAKSMMTALLQTHVTGVYVVAAVPNLSAGSFTIYLNKAVTTSVGPIAWMVTETP